MRHNCGDSASFKDVVVDLCGGVSHGRGALEALMEVEMWFATVAKCHVTGLLKRRAFTKHT
jgi:hypothetical protein